MKNRKRIIILGLIASLLLAPGAAAEDFSDVAPGAWYYGDVTACADLGIVTGYDGKFNSEDPVTGVQFIAMLTRTFYAEEVAKITVPDGQPWYYPNVKAAEDLKLSDINLVFTNDPIDRYDMAQALYNIIYKEGKELDKSGPEYQGTTDAIKDIDSIPSHRTLAVKMCYALGILTGMDGGNFNGDASMTRAQACTVIMRMIKLIDGSVPDAPVSTPQPEEQPEEKPSEETAVPGATLANGKPITTENVLEILEEIQTKYPKGTDYYTNFCTSEYDGDVRNLLWTWKRSDGTTYTSITQGCGGYARMVSDTIFGKTGFPARKVENPSGDNVRPGDIVITYTDSSHTKIQHVGVVWKTQVQGLDGALYFNTTDAANANTGVTWPTVVSSKSFTADQAVYTRYPD